MDDHTKKTLTQSQLRAELETRKNRLDHHLAGIRSEVTFADLNVGGRPVLDHVREQPLLAAGLALGAGVLVGLVTGLMGREAPEAPGERELWLSAYLDDLIEEGGSYVRRGDDSASALRKALRRRAPVIVLESEENPRAQARGTIGLVLNTALGFGVKLALDRIAQQLTGEEEIMNAVNEAAEQDEAMPEPEVYTRVEPGTF